MALPNKQLAVYGAGGVGKTGQLYSLAKWLWVSHGLKTMVVTADGGDGGQGGVLGPGIDMGAIKFYRSDVYPNPIHRMNQFVCGEAPLEPGNPQSKWAPVDFVKEGIGALCIEGLTSWGQVILDWSRDEHAKGNQIGQMEGSKLFFNDGDFKMGINTPVHFGIGQSYLGTFVNKAKRLWEKGLPIIVWTALESKVELKGNASQAQDSRPTAYGPKLPGSAATAMCIPWFTDVLHLDVVDPKKQPDGTILGDRKLFLTQHYATNDPTPYLAKNSVCVDGKMPTVIPPNLGLFFEEMAKANERAKLGWTKKE